ncbi:SDR family oxidoreductase [Bacillus shivajii]|uniref:SDR family NAD(P)-dependent oxidoreductase n=1 Tax=Bacillus shivajii TaxID=1983719 RepID=UPI001CFB6D9C|nr:SDR family NAD(P)-dependent oxidoreductase [Bacillus shivajii]UCZ54907.1 SDR family oxidoreductase [Bacillus shivajii]
MLYSPAALAEKHYLVTGATGGIGQAIVIALCQAGAKVTGVGRSYEKNEALLSRLKVLRIHESYKFVCADLTKKEDREQLCTTENTFYDGLINNAGVLGGTTIDQLTEEDIRSVMEVNYTATVLLTQQFYNRLVNDKKRGVIVNISSLSGLRGTYGNGAYAASKFALNGFMQCFALEAIKQNIRVNSICPGYVETKMGEKAIQKKADFEQKSFQEAYDEANLALPSGRITKPEEVANTCVFLCSDAAENIVGEQIKISGGGVL